MIPHHVNSSNNLITPMLLATPPSNIVRRCYPESPYMYELSDNKEKGTFLFSTLVRKVIPDGTMVLVKRPGL